MEKGFHEFKEELIQQIRVHDTLESPTAKTSLEYYLKKLQEVRRELYG